MSMAEGRFRFSGVKLYVRGLYDLAKIDKQPNHRASLTTAPASRLSSIFRMAVDSLDKEAPFRHSLEASGLLEAQNL